MTNIRHLLLPVVLLLSACGGDTSTSTSDTTPTATASNPAVNATFTDTAPVGDAVPIPEARQTAQPGQDIILEGRIMGVMTPFVENRAVFILGDNATITPCTDMEGDDHCDTPWDACCDPSNLRKEGTATIQIVDAEGAVIKQGLEGVKGLEKLAAVRVAGTLAANASPEVLIVNAKEIYVGAPGGQ